MPRQFKRLVIPPLPKPPAMQGNRHDEVYGRHGQKTAAMLGKQLPQVLCKHETAPVLKLVNGVSERAGIDSNSPGTIKTLRGLSAVSAQMIFPGS
jgi:hypothetical protein